MYCFDTDILIELFRGNEQLRAKFEKVDSSGAEIAITAINLCELYKGAFLSKNTEQELTKIAALLGRVSILGLGADACRIFGRTYSKLRAQGKLVSEADLLIASAVMARNFVLITRNRKDFENIPGLKFVVW